MIKFSKQATNKPNTINQAGGEAYKATDKLELVSLLLTSFLQDRYHESGHLQMKRLVEASERIPNKKFIAKAAIFARTEFGMRSVTHVLLAELCDQVKDQSWLKFALAQGIYRPDDIIEIVSYYLLKHKNVGYNKGLPAALRKAISHKLNRFDEYQLAKYKNDNAQVKMVDILNLVHPKGNEKQNVLFKALISGNLKNTETWEAKMSKAGQEAKGQDDLLEKKGQVWHELLHSKKLGYFALLRNLRNILEQAPDCVEEACRQLTNPEVIKKSLVLPFRFVTAIEEIQKVSCGLTQEVLQALNKAADISLSNTPTFPGKTLIAIDMSGSMNGKIGQQACLFGSALYKNNNADMMLFDSTAHMVQIIKTDGLLTMADRIYKMFRSGGTDFHMIFGARDKYDRIIILSDMQSWVNSGVYQGAFKEYCDRVKHVPFMHCIDLSGSGSLQFPENKVCTIAGFSDKLFDILKIAEIDRNAMINEIEKIRI